MPISRKAPTRHKRTLQGAGGWQVSTYTLPMRLIMVLILAASCAGAQDLRRQVRRIADEAQGTVSTACWLSGTNLNCDDNAHGHPPMQSVFKLPLAIAVLHQLEQGKFTLDQPEGTTLQTVGQNPPPPPTVAPAPAKKKRGSKK